MPNWAYSTLTAIGAPSDVDACVAQLAKPYDREFVSLVNKDGELVGERETATVKQDFSFWNIVRPSDDIIEEYNSVRRADNTRTGWLPEAITGPGSLLEEDRKAPISNHWYDWNIRNWGTKWDTDAEFERFAPDHAFYRFETAWSPPVDAITALSAQHPSLVFTLEWEEEQGFGGVLEFRGGSVEELESWDIPDSHEDHEKRERACVCEFDDDPQYWYDDCPREVAA